MPIMFSKFLTTKNMFRSSAYMCIRNMYFHKSSANIYIRMQVLFQGFLFQGKAFSFELFLFNNIYNQSMVICLYTCSLTYMYICSFTYVLLFILDILCNSFFPSLFAMLSTPSGGPPPLFDGCKST